MLLYVYSPDEIFFLNVALKKEIQKNVKNRTSKKWYNLVIPTEVFFFVQCKMEIA